MVTGLPNFPPAAFGPYKAQKQARQDFNDEQYIYYQVISSHLFYHPN